MNVFRRRISLMILLAVAFLLTVDLGGLWQALPAIAADLDADSTQMLWVNDGYGLATSAGMIVLGTLSDRWGPRRMLLAGAGLFLAASVAAAYSSSPFMLIGARMLLGVAGAALIPSALAIIALLYPEAGARRRAIASWIGALSAGVALGPVIGGLLLPTFGWGAVFLLAVPVMSVLLIAMPFLLPRTGGTPRKTDLIGAVLLVGGSFLLVAGIKNVGVLGFDWRAGVELGGAAALLVLFGARQRRAEHPLIDVRLFASRRFTVAIMLLLLALTAMNGVHPLMPSVLQVSGNVDPFSAGVWLVPSALGLVIGAQTTPLVAARIGSGATVLGGALLATGGFALIAADLLLLGGTVPVLAGGMTLVLFGLAPMTVLGTEIAVSSVPPDRAGHAAAIGQTAYEMGLVLGIAITGSAAAAQYRHAVYLLAPDDLADGAVRRIAESMTGGLEIAQGMGAVSGAAVDTVRAAVASGMAVAAAVSAVLAVALGATAFVLLRVPTGRHTTTASPQDPASRSSSRASRRRASVARDA